MPLQHVAASCIQASRPTEKESLNADPEPKIAPTTRREKVGRKCMRDQGNVESPQIGPNLRL